MQKNKSLLLGKENVFKLLIKLSIPSIAGLIIIALYNIVDSIFIGRAIGVDGLAALTIIFPIHLLIMAISQMLGIGGQSVVSISLGQGDEKKADKTFTMVVLLSIFIGGFFSFFIKLFNSHILTFLGAGSQVFLYAQEYLNVLVYGMPFLIFFIAINNIARGEGNPKVALNTMIIAASVNIFLDYFFIFYLKYGMRGAALASVIAQIICSAYLVGYFLSKKSSLNFKLCGFFICSNIMKKIINVGFASFLRQVGAGIVILISNRIFAGYGSDLSIALFGIFNRLLMFVSMPVFGVLQGVNPIVGYNYGAEKIIRVKKAVLYSILISTLFVTFATVLIFIFPENILRVFSEDELLIEKGKNYLKIFFAMLPLIGVQIIGAGIFQALGKAKISIFLNSLRQIFVIIPLIYIFSILFGQNGVWIAFPFAEFIVFIITLFFLFFRIFKAEYTQL
ncbi:MAG: MATE family efflux transporter [Candidatus Muiribacteriota bacterium]